jgi:anti-anti-sigma factor
MQPEVAPVRWLDRLAVVTLPEEIDLSNGGAVHDSLAAALSQQPAALVVDMSSTTYCDSAGVRAVMLAGQQAAAAGCTLRLVIDSPAVMRVFSLIGADELVEVHERLASALGPAGPADGRHDGGPPPAADGNHDGGR